MLGDLRIAAGYTTGLRPYLGTPLAEADCRRELERRLADRARTFLLVLKRGVYEHPTSPYLKLLGRANIEFGDVERLVGEKGVEGSLSDLFDAGVRIDLSEVQAGMIQRGGLELPLSEHALDNPLLAHHYEAQSGGSRSVGRRTAVDLGQLAHEAAYWSLVLRAFEMSDAPAAIWMPAPPGFAGLVTALMHAKGGRKVERWFSQSTLELRRGETKNWLLAAATVTGGRLWGRGIAWPEHVPAEQARSVAAWLAEKTRAGTPAVLATNASGAVRACASATAADLDIGGTFFALGGEPWTAPRARIVAEVGAKAGSFYGMSQIAGISAPCAHPTASDDGHVLQEKVGMIQRPRSVGADGSHVEALFLTALLPTAPKLMLNVESGDYGVVEERHCGCVFDELGLHRHLHTIRSHEKLTSEGTTFLGEDLISLVEEVLPARFGGDPTDYQLVEEEDSATGRVRVKAIASERLGDLDEPQLKATILEYLRGAGDAQRMMAELWRDGDALVIDRRQPHVTPAGKILPLHLLERQR